MANFNNASKVISIQARQGVVARVVVNSQVSNGQKASMRAYTAQKPGASDIALELGMFALTAEQLIKASIDHVLILVGSNTATRFYEAQKALKDTGSVDGAIAKVQGTIAKWQSNNPGLDEALPEAIRAYFAIREAGLDVTIGKLTETHLFELDAQLCRAAEIADGQTLTFVDGVDTEFGIVCRDTSYLSGEHAVIVRGNRFYVERSGNSNLGIRRLIGWNETEAEKDKFEAQGLKRDVLSAYKVLRDKLPHAADEAELVEDESADI